MLKKLLVALATLSIGLPALSQTVAAQSPPGPAGPQAGPGAKGPAGPPALPASGRSGDTLVTTQAQFVTAVNAAISGCYVVNFATGSKFFVTGTMDFVLGDCGHTPVGWNGNGLTITNEKGAVNNGKGIIRITSSDQNRSFIATGTAVHGGGYQGFNSGDCVTVTQATANRPIYKFTLRDWWIDYCGRHGLVLSGDVYEGSVWNLNSENNNNSGLYLSHLPGHMILSNIFLIGINSSRNKAYGVEAGNAANGIQLTQFSFVNNAKGGALFPWGVRSVTSGNCENSGQVCVDVGTALIGTTIFNVEASTDCGVQHAGGTGIMKYAWRGGPADKLWTGAIFITGFGYCTSASGVQVKAP